jgi:hypothetical protein
LVTTETSVIAFFVWCGDGWLFPCRRAILAVGLPAGALLVDLLWLGLLWPALIDSDVLTGKRIGFRDPPVDAGSGGSLVLLR